MDEAVAADAAIGWPPGDVHSLAVEQYFDGSFAYASVADMKWGMPAMDERPAWGAGDPRVAGNGQRGSPSRRRAVTSAIKESSPPITAPKTTHPAAALDDDTATASRNGTPPSTFAPIEPTAMTPPVMYRASSA